MIESLAESIAQMPLAPSALAETRITATRLVQLLPATTQGSSQGGAAKAKAPSMPEWVPITILYCAMAFGMALNALLIPTPSSSVATPVEQPTAMTGAAGLALVSSPHEAAVVGSPPAPARQ